MTKYNVFRSSLSWASLCDQVARWIDGAKPAIIAMTQSQDGADGVIIVWYQER